ncbi:MAG TPA: glutamate mutase L, partial [Pseudonocardia sp.]|nr:glutamate mutase L [Pseudonocardia sp.]
MPTDQAAAVCLDVGSTWTKAVLVRPDGALAGFAEHPTTSSDVLTGMDAAVRAVAAAAPIGPAGEPELLACSSAGGGLRLAVVGSERLTSTEAGHRVACSSGARVVHVHVGRLQR